MGLDLEPREPTVRDPRNAETEYRVSYRFVLQSALAPWLVEVPVGHDGTYLVTVTVEREPEDA